VALIVASWLFDRVDRLAREERMDAADEDGERGALPAEGLGDVAVEQALAVLGLA
jgi:hypothetical protein